MGQIPPPARFSGLDFLYQLLNEVVFSRDSPDTLVWAPYKSGEFSVKSLSMQLLSPHLAGKLLL